jgi:hypothetical protein
MLYRGLLLSFIVIFPTLNERTNPLESKIWLGSCCPHSLGCLFLTVHLLHNDLDGSVGLPRLDAHPDEQNNVLAGRRLNYRVHPEHPDLIPAGLLPQRLTNPGPPPHRPKLLDPPPHNGLPGRLPNRHHAAAQAALQPPANHHLVAHLLPVQARQ